jgi:signal transduction histidine kinase
MQKDSIVKGALDGISIRARLCLICSTLIMLVFFTVQTCVVFDLFSKSMFLLYYAEFGWYCVIAFMPPFFMVVREFLKNKAYVTKKLKQKNIYLEHAAKIIRHDMHSGINTYLPRGIKSLKRRISDDTIKDLKITAPLQLIQDGLHHAQKVYAGVYEFTNLVKENAVLNKSVCNIKAILEDYLKLTAYKSQVLLDSSLDVEIEVNEALFCTAIDNLIRNGLKYNDSPSKWVKLNLTESRIIIEDNGRGLTGDEFIELSKPYARKEGQKEQGTGLGLNICIEILKEHKFSILAEKKNLENGTIIYINIDS